MEPQLFSCGLCNNINSSSTKTKLQWSRNFSVADCCKVLKLNYYTPYFNGAATFQLRIDQSRISLMAHHTQLQWSRNFSVADCIQYIQTPIGFLEYFNGAATFQLRIADVRGIPTRSHHRLQWSRNFSVADWRCAGNSKRAVFRTSMEPQLFSCGLHTKWICLTHDQVSLQWSRNFSVADWLSLVMMGQPRNLTSMEPQLFSCGLMWVRGVPKTLVMDFNGAATFQLRIVGDAGKGIGDFFSLQWSRNFSVADCWIKCINGEAWISTSMEPQLFSCGLGIVVVGAIRLVVTSMEPQLFSCGLPLKTAPLKSHCSITSMEPQLFSCGLRLSRSTAQTIPPLQWSRNFSVADCRRYDEKWIPRGDYFNGAATFQLRIATPVSFVKGELANFNGAATFQLRIAIEINGSGNDIYLLQWSRNFSVADCTNHCLHLWLIPHHFNGAATFQLRIAFNSESISSFNSTSMEPQLFSCGLLSAVDIMWSVSLLQWSRNFSVADCFRPRIFGSSRLPTSMEPQLFSCGLRSKIWTSKGRCLTSMEPQLFSCGLLVMLNMEMSDLTRLQWSRNFSVADCGPNMKRQQTRGLHFNGAATFQLRIENG